MSRLTAQRGSVEIAPANRPNGVLALVDRIPPEAIVKLVEVIGDVIRSRASLAENHAAFVREMDLLYAKSTDRERIMSTLSALLLNAELAEEQKTRLVDTICQLALR